MKKHLSIISSLVTFLFLASCAASPGEQIGKQAVPTATSPAETALQPEPTATAISPSATPSLPDHLNTSYEIDGTQVQLAAGMSEVEAAPGSATKIITRVLPGQAVGDLNGDGADDVAFLLTQEGGGSGTFYYAAAAWSTSSGAAGSNAVLLGDRIEVQSLAVEYGTVNVTYADRPQGASFTEQPSLTLTRHFTLQDGFLVETYLPSQIQNRPWTWVLTQMNDGSRDTPNRQGAFTLTFGEDGRVSGTTDCNSFFGSYTLKGNQISFSEFAATKMYCEGSQEAQFLKFLAEVQSFLIVRNQLVLEIKYDSGQIIFE